MSSYQAFPSVQKQRDFLCPKSRKDGLTAYEKEIYKERQAYPVGGSLLADDDNSSADVRLCVDERGR